MVIVPPFSGGHEVSIIVVFFVFIAGDLEVSGIELSFSRFL